MDDHILRCRNLGKRYGNHTALAGVDLDIPRGRITGLLGQNGSGKTTFMKLVSGLLVPSEGEVLVGGHRPGPESKKIVSYLPATEYLPQWMTVENLLGFFRDFYEDFDRNTAEDMLERLSISPKARLKTLSKGTKEKVQLILAMSREAELYLLDEPIGGVDPASRDYILKTIISNYREDSSVIISTHLIADVEPILDDVIFIQNGQIVLRRAVDDIRENEGKSVDAYFREVFRC